jgi:hypothetical protein
LAATIVHAIIAYRAKSADGLFPMRPVNVARFSRSLFVVWRCLRAVGRRDDHRTG